MCVGSRPRCPPDSVFTVRVCPSSAPGSPAARPARPLFTSGSPTGHPYHTGRSGGVPTMAICGRLGGPWGGTLGEALVHPRCWVDADRSRKVNVSSAEQGEAMATPTVSIRPHDVRVNDDPTSEYPD